MQSFVSLARSLSRFHGEFGSSAIVRRVTELRPWLVRNPWSTQTAAWVTASSAASAAAAADWKLTTAADWKFATVADWKVATAAADWRFATTRLLTWDRISRDITGWVGVERSLLSVAQEFAGSWITDLARLPDVVGWLDRLDLGDTFPPNWPTLAFSQAHRLAFRDGLPVCWVPQANILELLRDTPGVCRRQVLLSHRLAIIDHCTLVLGEVDAPELADYADAAAALLDAMRNGHDRPAQAYAMNIIDAILRDARGNASGRNFYGPLLAHVSTTQDPTMAELRRAATLWPLIRLFAPYRPGPGGLIPDQANRHATAHTVDPVQYTPANALVSVMIAISILRETQHGLHGGRAKGELLAIGNVP